MYNTKRNNAPRPAVEPPSPPFPLLNVLPTPLHPVARRRLLLTSAFRWHLATDEQLRSAISERRLTEVKHKGGGSLKAAAKPAEAVGSGGTGGARGSRCGRWLSAAAAAVAAALSLQIT